MKGRSAGVRVRVVMQIPHRGTFHGKLVKPGGRQRRVLTRATTWSRTPVKKSTRTQAYTIMNPNRLILVHCRDHGKEIVCGNFFLQTMQTIIKLNYIFM